MLDNIEYAFPAGDESDGSSDEWDVGFISTTKKSDPEVISHQLISAVANVSALGCVSLHQVFLVNIKLKGL